MQKLIQRKEIGRWQQLFTKAQNYLIIAYVIGFLVMLGTKITM